MEEIQLSIHIRFQNGTIRLFTLSKTKLVTNVTALPRYPLRTGHSRCGRAMRCFLVPSEKVLRTDH